MSRSQRSHASALQSGAGTAARPPEQAMFQPELGRSLRMHRKLALLVMLAGFGITALYFFHLWPTYEAKSLVYVQPASSGVMNQNNYNRWPMDNATYEGYIGQKMGDVTRPDVMTAALHKMRPGLFQQPGESDQAAADRLGHAIQVDRSGTYQMSIGVRGPKADMAADIANAVTTAYLEAQSHDSRAGDTQRLAILKEEHDRVQAELEADRAEQAVLSRQLGMAAPTANAPNFYDEQIARTRDELIRIRTEHDEAAARFTTMNAAGGGSGSAVDAQADEQAAADPGLVSMKTALYQRKSALVSQMANLTPNHPLYKQDAAELEKINNELEAASRNLHQQAAGRIQQKLQSDMQRTASVEDKLNSQLRAAVGAAASASVKMQRANDLNADITRLQTRFAAVDEQLHNMVLDSGAPGAVSLVAAAVPPLHPMRSGVLRNTLALQVFSVLLGLFAAILAQKMDPHVYIASDVEQVLGFAPMAELPNFAQVSEQLEAEQLIRLAGDIGHVAIQDGIRTVALTSPTDAAGVRALAARLRPLLAADVEILEAAAVLLSAEAEFQVRTAGWAIAVIDSGETTRAELRSFAAALRRLDVPAVGFVLHQVALEKAEPAFRQAVLDAERHLKSSGVSRTVRTVKAAAPAASPVAAVPPAEPLPESLPVPEVPAVAYPSRSFEPAQPAAAAVPPALPAAPVKAAEPWWLAEIAPDAEQIERQANPVAARQSSFAAEAFPLELPTAPPAAGLSPVDESAHSSRLNGLRGAAFQIGLRQLNRSAEGVDPTYARPVPPKAAPAPFVDPTVKFQPVVPTAAPIPSASELPRVAAPPVCRTPKPAPAPLREVLATPEYLPPKEFIPVGDESQVRSYNDPFGEAGILPAKRGQYRKKR